MKKSKKHGNEKIFKLVLIVFEVVLIIAMVSILFSNIWNFRPEKSKTESTLGESYFARAVTVEPTSNLSPIATLKAKTQPEPPSFEEIVAGYVFDICESYPSVDPYLVLSVIYQESRFTPNVSLGGCVGLMQVSTYWHRDRAGRLGVTDFYDPYGNVLIGIDLLDELITRADGDIYYALMLYNQTYSSARQMYSQGIISDYAKSVVSRANEYREVYSNG